LDGASRQRTRRRVALRRPGGGRGIESLLALAVVVGVAVLPRHEVVLFLYGVLAGGSDTVGVWR